MKIYWSNNINKDNNRTNVNVIWQNNTYKYIHTLKRKWEFFEKDDQFYEINPLNKRLHTHKRAHKLVVVNERNLRRY